MCVLAVLYERVTFRSRPEGRVELCHAGKEEKSTPAQVTAHVQALKKRTAQCSRCSRTAGARGVGRGRGGGQGEQ